MDNSPECVHNHDNICTQHEDNEQIEDWLHNKSPDEERDRVVAGTTSEEEELIKSRWVFSNKILLTVESNVEKHNVAK